MATQTVASSHVQQKLAKSNPGLIGTLIFLAMLVGGLIFITIQLGSDLSNVHNASIFPYVLLGVALLIALGFEFVNGFHDTANAVATCIYTHSLEPHIAVVYSGVMNFVGVLVSSGAVAYSIITLLPVELILKVSGGSGFAMVFALLIAAIIWNLATWWRGLPASSSHTMIGSIIGVGIANQMMQGNPGTAGVEWDQVTKVFTALLVSPLVGFSLAILVFFTFKVWAKFPALGWVVFALSGGWAIKNILDCLHLVAGHFAAWDLVGSLVLILISLAATVALAIFNYSKKITDPQLFAAPEGTDPPPFFIRLLLIGTCGGVSYAHGSNDGQKGMGLIMLILVGTVPTAYALNHAVGQKEIAAFAQVSTSLVSSLDSYKNPGAVFGDPQQELSKFVSSKPNHFTPSVIPALQEEITEIRNEVVADKTLAGVPPTKQANVRNQMYLVSEAFKLLAKSKEAPKMSAADLKQVSAYKSFLDRATRFIPAWVKVAVALALGLGTMVGWKRIVVTVGEKIGKTHLTYAQGASAELVAMATILAADSYGLPVSTTHVLSSGIAGTMAANKSGLQMSTIRDIALAWIFTLPAAAVLSGVLFFIFNKIVGA